MNSQPRRRVDKDKMALFDHVTDAIQASGWNILFAGPADNPLQIIMQHEDVSFPLTVYIWHVTHGGGYQRPAQEYRIQLTGVSQISVVPGRTTLLLGWWEAGGVFAGFDASKHAGRVSKSPSIQISENALQQAPQRGLVPYPRGNGEIAFAIRPDMLATYIQEITILHEIGTQPGEVEVIESAPDDLTEDSSAVDLVAEPRREAIRTVRMRIRKAQFRQRVLTAYDNACALCAMQLELVEAAHIVPVAYPDSPDVVANGIALCALHHKAYDRGVLTAHLREGAFRTAINVREINRLASEHLAGGYEQFKSQLLPSMRLPTNSALHPNREYLTLGNRLRRWSDADFDDSEIVEFIQ